MFLILGKEEPLLLVCTAAGQDKSILRRVWGQKKTKEKRVSWDGFSHFLFLPVLQNPPTPLTAPTSTLPRGLLWTFIYVASCLSHDWMNTPYPHLRLPPVSCFAKPVRPLPHVRPRVLEHPCVVMDFAFFELFLICLFAREQHASPSCVTRMALWPVHGNLHSPFCFAMF